MVAVLGAMAVIAAYVPARRRPEWTRAARCAKRTDRRVAPPVEAHEWVTSLTLALAEALEHPYPAEAPAEAELVPSSRHRTNTSGAPHFARVRLLAAQRLDRVDAHGPQRWWEDSQQRCHQQSHDWTSKRGGISRAHSEEQ